MIKETNISVEIKKKLKFDIFECNSKFNNIFVELLNYSTKNSLIEQLFN